jgi:predicted thioesterase
MKQSPKVGDSVELSFLVTEQHVIDFADDQMPAVLCTPWLIWFLEHAAREAMLPLLDPGESTVGSHIDVEHLAATPIGHQVRCTAQVIHFEGSIVSFSLKAYDERELIACGTHKLRVILVERFAKRVNAKRTPTSST